MAPVAMDSLGYLGLALIPLYLIFVLAMAKFCSMNARAERRQAEAERAELDGSWSDYLARMEATQRRVDERRAEWQRRAS